MIKLRLFILLISVAFYANAQNEDPNDPIRKTSKGHDRLIKHQQLNADSVRRIIESAPYFTLYKDNYFSGGSTTNIDKMTAANSNVKFQLSIGQKLTRSKLPFNTYLFIQFTQKTIWNVLEESLPIYDMNFNPGIALGHLIIHNNKYVGRSYLMLEHESNGKDSLASRSWNKITLGATYRLTNNFEVQGKIWAPIVDGQNNKDILKYNGLAQTSFCYQTDNQRLHACLTTTYRKRWFGLNTQWELSYKINHNENQYIFLQYYNGYGEYLLDYNKFQSVLRIGFVIKPQGFSLY